MRLTLTRPDDWHLHLRDGEMLKSVLPDTARRFARAIAMPNLVPPVVNAAQSRNRRFFKDRVGLGADRHRRGHHPWQVRLRVPFY